MSKIKRICMLSTHGYFDPEPILGATDTGGQVTYVLELSKHLAQLGYKVDIYTRRFADRSEIDPVNDDVRVIRIPCGSNEFIRKEDLFPHLDELADNMLAFMKKHGLSYEVFHSHYWDAGYVSMRVAEKLGTHFFYTAHSLGAWKREQMGGDPEEMEKLFKFKERVHWENIIFRAARAQTVTTIDGKENYKRLYEFESPALVIIPPGVDTKRFRPLQPGEQEQPLDVPDNYVFALSRIDSNKGHDYLIRAFAKAAPKCKSTLVIGGGSKNPKQHEIDVKANLEKIIAELGIGDRVTFTGYITDADLATYYRKANVFILPSKYEPFGMTTLEAMSCGTPVIATKYGGIKDDLKHNVDSLLVDPTDEDEFAEAMVQVLTDKKLAARLSEGGMNTIHRTFSWESIAARTIKFYEEFSSAKVS